jgi:hypothetical protein
MGGANQRSSNEEKDAQEQHVRTREKKHLQSVD